MSFFIILIKENVYWKRTAKATFHNCCIVGVKIQKVKLRKLIAVAIKHFFIFYNIKRKYVLENDCQGTISFRFKLEPGARNSALGPLVMEKNVKFIAEAIKYFVIFL